MRFQPKPRRVRLWLLPLLLIMGAGAAHAQDDLKIQRTTDFKIAGMPNMAQMPGDIISPQVKDAVAAVLGQLSNKKS